MIKISCNYINKEEEVYQLKLIDILIRKRNILKQKKRYIQICILEEQIKRFIPFFPNNLDILYNELTSVEYEIKKNNEELLILNIK